MAKGQGKNLKGVQLWKLRKRHGVEKKYKTAAQIWAGALNYFQWCVDNPILQKVALSDGDSTKSVRVIPKMRAMTLEGLSVHLGITHRTWNNYANRPEFALICHEIETIIFEQKFTGAAAGELNANIISRHLGLGEVVKVAANNDEPIPIKWIKSSDD